MTPAAAAPRIWRQITFPLRGDGAGRRVAPAPLLCIDLDFVFPGTPTGMSKYHLATAALDSPNAAEGLLRLELLCADDFGAGYKDDLTDEDAAHIINYDETRAAQLAMAEEAESRGIEGHVSESDDRDSRHSDAYLYFPPSRLDEVAEMLDAVGLEGDILDVPKGFTSERRIHGWTVEEHEDPDWHGA